MVHVFAIDYISLPTIFKFCTSDKFKHMFTNCYTRRYFFFNIRCDFILGGKKGERVILTISPHGPCLHVFTNYYVHIFFFKLGVIYHWAGKSVCVCEVDKKGGMDNISLRPMFKFCTNDKFMHLFTNCYTSRYSRYIFLN